MDENGVTDYSSMFAIGFISWADIAAIGFGGSNGTNWIEVALYDKAQSIERFSGIAKKALPAKQKERIHGNNSTAH